LIPSAFVTNLEVSIELSAGLQLGDLDTPLLLDYQNCIWQLADERKFIFLEKKFFRLLEVAFSWLTLTVPSL